MTASPDRSQREVGCGFALFDHCRLLAPSCHRRSFASAGSARMPSPRSSNASVSPRPASRDGLDLVDTFEELDVSGGAPLEKRPGLRPRRRDGRERARPTSSSSPTSTGSSARSLFRPRSSTASSGRAARSSPSTWAGHERQRRPMALGDDARRCLRIPSPRDRGAHADAKRRAIADGRAARSRTSRPATATRATGASSRTRTRRRVVA